MRKHSTSFPPPPKRKLSTDMPPATPKTKSNEELELLKKILIEARHFSGPASGKGQQPAKVARKGNAAVANRDPGRRGTV